MERTCLHPHGKCGIPHSSSVASNKAVTTLGDLKTIFDYHERTKHHFDRYARSLGFMDWNTQPDPFRRYGGAPLHRLEIPEERDEPAYDSLFTALPPPQPLTRGTISQLFYYSLALSAWKQVRRPGGGIQARWSLRVDPSSGNLHPTEGYLICGPVEGLCGSPAVYHYAPHEHALELRCALDRLPGLPPGAALVGITSIHWRESWKYGERAFRYCQHDCGHVIAAVALSAACLGWRTRLIDSIATGQLGALLGVDSQEGPEAEHPDCLLLVSPAEQQDLPASESWDTFLQTAQSAVPVWLGTPNKLSHAHHPWPVIEEVSEASRSGGFTCPAPAPPPAPRLPDRGLSAHRIIRQRRSAVAMDGETSMDRASFYRLLQRVMPQPLPYGTLSWKPAISLLLFVNRVDGLDKGLYLLVRDASHERSLRDSMRGDFLWEKPEACPPELPLYLLVPADARDAARTVSCHQDIAADGAFAAGMLARFEETLQPVGPAMYPRLFWETGAIGQVLYLEAEAAGVRSTGIGCFFDDAVHKLLGMEGRSWQSLYHFTIGGPVDDPRLETAAAYNHL